MQRGFATGELQDFDPAFAINHPLYPFLQIGDRHCIDAACARRVGVAGRAREIARMDDFDQREAGA
jgi:hypothetical protein